MTDVGAKWDENGFDKVESDKEEAWVPSSVIEDMFGDLLVNLSKYNVGI